MMTPTPVRVCAGWFVGGRVLTARLLPVYTHSQIFMTGNSQPQFKVEALALAGTEMYYFHLGKNNIHIFWFDYQNSTMEILNRL